MSANLPPLPEPYSASSAIKCATCGASYKPGYSLMPQGNGFPSLIRQTACQGCGGTSFTASIGYDSPSPAKYTAGQMHAYATEAIAAQAAEMEALRADAALLQWILSHPETCAEELEDACASLLDPRTCLERRKAGIEAAARAALKEQAPNLQLSGALRPLERTVRPGGSSKHTQRKYE